MTVLRGDCVEVMAGMEPDSVDAIVCDPPYGLEFMGKEWDRLGGIGKTSHSGPAERDATTPYGRTRVAYSGSSNVKCLTCSKWQWDHPGRKCECEHPVWPNVAAHQGVLMAEWHHAWAAAALRVAKPGAYLLAFGGTRTVHRMTCALEDAGWVIRDMLVWAYAQGFPKSRASLKPAWEPIVMARKPGASRDLNIDAARIGDTVETWPATRSYGSGTDYSFTNTTEPVKRAQSTGDAPPGRWPANVILTDPIFDGGWDGVVGGGEQSGGGNPRRRLSEPGNGLTMGRGWNPGQVTGLEPFDTSGTYSRFFLIPKAPTRERVLSDGRRSPHPTQKPEALIRHLVTLVTPEGGVVLDCFLGSGTLGVVCDGLGIRWQGIERDETYADWAQDRIADQDHGLGLRAPVVVKPRKPSKSRPGWNGLGGYNIYTDRHTTEEGAA